jgi:hypothetical protein
MTLSKGLAPLPRQNEAVTSIMNRPSTNTIKSLIHSLTTIPLIEHPTPAFKMSAPQTPIIIGVADIKNRSTALADAHEPASLIYKAILAAIQDASAPNSAMLQSAIDSIDVVRTWTWPYADLPGLLGEKLGVKDGLKRNFYSEHGGDKPGKLLDEAARRVARGEVGVAVVCGGEALASCELGAGASFISCFYNARSAGDVGLLMQDSNCLRCSEKDSTTWLDGSL